MLFQENDRLGFCINVISLCPNHVTFSFSFTEFRFNINQPFYLAVGIFASWCFRNVSMMTVERLPQFRFRVFLAKAVQTNIAFTTRRLYADMSAAFDPASRFFHQLHECIKSIRLHSQHSINCNAQGISACQFGLIAFPSIIRNCFVLWILNDGKMMFATKFVTDLSNKTAGVPHIPEFMRVVQCCCTEYNVIMEPDLSRIFLTFPQSGF